MPSIRTRVIATLICLHALTGAAAAANLPDIMRDTQRLATQGDQVTMVWWVPTQFWEESMKASPMVTEAARRQVIDAMGEYTIVAYMRARTGIGGLIDAQPKDELVKNARVTIDGKLVEALPQEQISPATAVLLAQMKPAIAATAGQFGQSVEFVVYPGKVDGKQLIDALQSGTLAITFYDSTYVWRLPLGSLLPPKVDKKTGETFPGNYDYNPFTGKKLEDK